MFSNSAGVVLMDCVTNITNCCGLQPIQETCASVLVSDILFIYHSVTLH